MATVNLNLNKFLEEILDTDGCIHMNNASDKQLKENQTQIKMSSEGFEFDEINEVELNQTSECAAKFTPDGKLYCKEFREIEKE